MKEVLIEIPRNEYLELLRTAIMLASETENEEILEYLDELLEAVNEKNPTQANQRLADAS